MIGRGFTVCSELCGTDAQAWTIHAKKRCDLALPDTNASVLWGEGVVGVETGPRESVDPPPTL